MTESKLPMLLVNMITIMPVLIALWLAALLLVVHLDAGITQSGIAFASYDQK